MRRLLIIITIISVQTAWSDDFHIFTSKDYKTVKARIIRVNASKTMIEIERKNGKKLWVERNIFSREDQIYIDNWIKNPTEEKTEAPAILTSPLTKKEVKSRVRQYGDVLEKKNYELYSGLCMDPLNKSEFDAFEIKSFSIERCDGNNAEVEFKIKYLSGTDLIKGKTIVRRGWVQFAPDGKIKYEPTYNFGDGQHPMISAMNRMGSLSHYNKPDNRTIAEKNHINRILNEFQDWGIPTYEYNTALSEDDRENTFENILDWMKDNYENWDATDPKIPCPEDAFKEQLDNLKK